MTTAPPEGTTLTTRQLNRSLLARQGLLERQATSVSGMIEHLVGMQSQVPKDPFVGLWTRIAGFGHAELDRLMLDREAVRLTLMRGTIHLVTARDAYALRPVLQRALEKVFTGNPTYAPRLEGLRPDDLLEAGRALLEANPMTGKHLGVHMAERWPDRDPVALSYAVRYILPLVQVTPRGVWGESHQPTLTTMEAWLGEPVDPHCEPDEAILRYLAAFGPATTSDIQAWSGLQGVRENVERLRPQLLIFRDERSRELFDVPGAPFPNVDTPAPARFLPGFENALLSHADRTRIVEEERRKSMWVANGLLPGTFLLDGFVAGTWKASRTKTAASLDIRPFAPLSATDRDELEHEALQLLAFVEDKAETHAVHFHDPP